MTETYCFSFRSICKYNALHCSYSRVCFAHPSNVLCSQILWGEGTCSVDRIESSKLCTDTNSAFFVVTLVGNSTPEHEIDQSFLPFLPSAHPDITSHLSWPHFNASQGPCSHFLNTQHPQHYHTHLPSTLASFMLLDLYTSQGSHGMPMEVQGWTDCTLDSTRAWHPCRLG